MVKRIVSVVVFLFTGLLSISAFGRGTTLGKCALPSCIIIWPAVALSKCKLMMVEVKLLMYSPIFGSSSNGVVENGYV